MSASEATETHKETRAFREDAAGCPEPPLLRHRLVKRNDFQNTWGRGWSLEVFGMSECGRAPSLPARCAVAAVVPKAGTALWSAHRSVVSGPGSRQGPGLAGRRAGPGPPSQERPASSGGSPGSAPAPLWVQPGRAPQGPEPLGAHSTPSPDTGASVRGGRVRDNSAYTGVHACLFLFFRKKRKSPFPVFHLFVVFFFGFLKFFFFFKL